MMSEMRLGKLEKALECAHAEGSCVLISGQTSDNYVRDKDLYPLTDCISLFSATKQMPTLLYTLDKDVEEITTPNCPGIKTMPCGGNQRQPSAVIDGVFSTLEKNMQPTTFIIDFAEALIPNPDLGHPSGETFRIQQQIVRRALDASFRGQRHLIVLISRVRAVDPAFAQMPGIVVHNISLPEQAEREAAIKIMLDSQNAPLYLAEGMSAERLGRISGGLNIDDISRMRRSTSPNAPLTRDTVLELKKDLIRNQSGETLTIHDEVRDLHLDIAGLSQLKLFIYNARADGRNIRVLLLGPPGTGKTLCATAVAMAMDTIPISFAQVKSMWVGESERMFRQAIDIIMRNAPVTIILDECDQMSMGSRSGSNMAQDSSSVDTSLRGMLLEWLGDVGANNGINIIAMSNNANGVDPAFRDRLTTIPILEPISAMDKARIAMIQLRRIGIMGDEIGITQAFTESSRGFTGRQIVKMLDKAIRTAYQFSNGVVGYEAMKVAIDNMLRSFGLAEELMSLRAIRFTDETEYLPWVASWIMGDGAVQPPEYLKECLSQDRKRIDEEKLDAHIAELVNRGF